MIGSTKEHCHRVHRQFTDRTQYLGIQDALRKFQPPSQDQAGAWTGKNSFQGLLKKYDHEIGVPGNVVERKGRCCSNLV